MKKFSGVKVNVDVIAGVIAAVFLLVGAVIFVVSAGGSSSGTSQNILADNGVLNTDQRIERNRQIAEDYYKAYDKKAVKDGESYASWIFADNATYWSPYFGMDEVDLSENPVSVADSATFEALSYSIEFPDWAPVDFEVYPSVDGVAWKTHFAGHQKDTGKYMDFFAYSYANTNEYGEITHWETHVNSDYNDFLDAAIGTHGPFKNGSGPYMQAVYQKIKSAGIDMSDLKH